MLAQLWDEALAPEDAPGEPPPPDPEDGVRSPAGTDGEDSGGTAPLIESEAAGGNAFLDLLRRSGAYSSFELNFTTMDRLGDRDEGTREIYERGNTADPFSRIALGVYPRDPFKIQEWWKVRPLAEVSYAKNFHIEALDHDFRIDLGVDNELFFDPVLIRVNGDFTAWMMDRNAPSPTYPSGWFLGGNVSVEPAIVWGTRHMIGATLTVSGGEMLHSELNDELTSGRHRIDVGGFYRYDDGKDVPDDFIEIRVAGIAGGNEERLFEIVEFRDNDSFELGGFLASVASQWRGAAYTAGLGLDALRETGFISHDSGVFKFKPVGHVGVSAFLEIPEVPRFDLAAGYNFGLSHVHAMSEPFYAELSVTAPHEWSPEWNGWDFFYGIKGMVHLQRLSEREDLWDNEESGPLFLGGGGGVFAGLRVPNR